MKKCPFCSGEIQDEAIKCKFCKTFLNDNSKDFLNKILNKNIEKTKNNTHLKKVDLSKAVFEIMEVGETLHINDIIKRIINGLNNKQFYFIPKKEDAQNRIGSINSFLSNPKSEEQKRVSDCFEKLGNGNFKMTKKIIQNKDNIDFKEENNIEKGNFEIINELHQNKKIEVKEDKNKEKKIKKTKNPGKNFIEKLFFSWFFRPKFVNLENINKSKLGRFFIFIYLFIFLLGIFIFPIVETCISYKNYSTSGRITTIKKLKKSYCDEYGYKIGSKDIYFEEYIFQNILLYFFMTFGSSLFYKLFLYIKNG